MATGCSCCSCVCHCCFNWCWGRPDYTAPVPGKDKDAPAPEASAGAAITAAEFEVLVRSPAFLPAWNTVAGIVSEPDLATLQAGGVPSKVPGDAVIDVAGLDLAGCVVVDRRVGLDAVKLLVAHHRVWNVAVVSIRGTDDVWDVITNLTITPAELPDVPGVANAETHFGRAHKGYLDHWNSVHDEVLAALGKARGVTPDMPVVVTGRSLGGAVAPIAAVRLHAALRNRLVGYVSIAAPRLATKAFGAFLGERSGIPGTFFFNTIDAVPAVPTDTGLWTHVTGKHVTVARFTSANGCCTAATGTASFEHGAGAKVHGAACCTVWARSCEQTWRILLPCVRLCYSELMEKHWMTTAYPVAVASAGGPAYPGPPTAATFEQTLAGGGGAAGAAGAAGGQRVAAVAPAPLDDSGAGQGK